MLHFVTKVNAKLFVDFDIDHISYFIYSIANITIRDHASLSSKKIALRPPGMFLSVYRSGIHFSREMFHLEIVAEHLHSQPSKMFKFTRISE